MASGAASEVGQPADKRARIEQNDVLLALKLDAVCDLGEQEIQNWAEAVQRARRASDAAVKTTREAFAKQKVTGESLRHATMADLQGWEIPGGYAKFVTDKLDEVRKQAAPGPAAPVAAEVPFQELRNAILADTWTVVPPTQMQPNLLGRQGVKDELVQYVTGVVNKDLLYWEGARSEMLATVGVKGIGKTRVLMEACTTWKEDASAKEAFRIDFNGGYSWDEGQSTCAAFSELLLFAAGMAASDAKRCALGLPLREVLRALREKLLMPETALLLIGVDEVVELEKARGPEGCTQFMRTLMGLQDASVNRKDQPVIFIWTSLTDRYMRQKATDSGRRLRSLGLPSLPQDEAVPLLPDDVREGLLSTKAGSQLVRQLLGHPRLLFDALPASIQESGLPTTASAFVMLRARIIEKAKLGDRKALTLDEVATWMAPGAVRGDDYVEELIARGLVHQLPVKAGHVAGLVMHPLVLRSWASAQGQRNVPLATQLRLVYEEDEDMRPDREENLERVMYRLDAAKRLALGNVGCTLNKIFQGGSFIPASLGNIIVTTGLTTEQAFVCVESFEEVECVMAYLRAGAVVVSSNRFQGGIEYLVPWTVAQEGDRQAVRKLMHPKSKTAASLLILGVQCKCVQDKVPEPWTQIETKASRALEPFNSRNDVLGTLPVFYTTEDRRIARTTTVPSINFTELGLVTLTMECVGPLLVLMEKAGSSCKEEHAWLFDVPVT